jgi:HSP20 family molecular chaperone IbpA
MSQLVRYDHARAGVPAFDGWDPMRLFSSFFGWDPLATRSGLRIGGDDDRVVVTADMPGVDESAVDVSYADGTLTLVGKRDDREYRYACHVGTGIDASRIEATLENGVLSVVAEKLPSAKPRRIPVVVKTKRGGSKRRLLFRKRG